MGEAQLEAKGHFHGDAQFSAKRNGENFSVGAAFDAELSADAELVGLDIQTGGHKKQKATQQAVVEATTSKEKSHKFNARFEGQANASAKGASVKINTPRPDKPHPTREAADLEIDATAQAQAIGVNVDIKTTDKPKPLPKSNSETNSHPKLRVQGKASASAMGIDVKAGSKLTVGEKSDAKTLEAHAHVEATGCEVKIGNKIEKPQFKGASASAKVKASGAAARLGNLYKFERDKGVAATAEARVAGAELNVGNINLDKGSSLGVAAVQEAKAGLTAFNVQVGIGGKAGIQSSTDASFGNIVFNLGPPSINIAPLKFNLGFGMGIKSSTGTAAKGGKGNASGEDGSNGSNGGSTSCGHNCGGGSTNYNGRNITDTDGSNENNASSYAFSGVNNGGDNNGSDHEAISSGVQFIESGNISTTNGDNNIGNVQDTQNTRDARAYCKTSSHRGYATGSGKNGANVESLSGHKLSNGNHNDGDLQDASCLDKNDCVKSTKGVTHSAAQFGYSNGSCNHTTITSGTLDGGGANHKNQSNGNITTSYSEDGHDGNNAMDHTSKDASHHNSNQSTSVSSRSHLTFSDDHNAVPGGTCHSLQLTRRLDGATKSQTNNAPLYMRSYQKHALHHGKCSSTGYSKGDPDGCGYGVIDTSTADASHQKSRKSTLVSSSHPTPYSDDQNPVISDKYTTCHNLRQLPRKLGGDPKLQANPPLYKLSAHSHSKYSSSGSSSLFGEVTHSDTKNDTKRKKKDDVLLNDNLSHKLSLALSRSRKSGKKVEKSKTPVSHQESKEELIQRLIEVREDLESEYSGQSTANDSATDGDVKSTLSSMSCKLSTTGKSSATDQQGIEDVEEVPMPDEKKKPLGCNNNIYTMDSIRTSTYKVQKSTKPLQKIGSFVVTFK